MTNRTKHPNIYGSRTAVRTGTYALLTAACFVLAGPSFGADVRPYISGSGSYRAIVIEGRIERGDFDGFVRIVRENQGQVSGAYCFSPGGDFDEAMKIGRAMRALELHSQAPMRGATGHPECEGGYVVQKPRDPKNCTCASAGFFIHIGAVHKGGTFLAVHRPSFASGRFGNLSQEDAKRAFEALQDRAREYMREMGVPQHVQEDVLGTPSDKILVLDEKTVKTYFWGDLPYRHEWIRNKCSRLSDAETARAQNYSSRFLRARSASDADLSKSELADFNALEKKQEDERNCKIQITKQSRSDAYEKFFHTKPSDFANHNFARWSEATKYLGKKFYELMSEEKFAEDKFLDQISLKRDATASAPAISLYDAPPTPKVVASVALFSTPRPSEEFIRRVVKSLEDAWGKPSAGNGATEWQWNQREFLAKLTHEPVSATGPFLQLIIDGK